MKKIILLTSFLGYTLFGILFLIEIVKLFLYNILIPGLFNFNCVSPHTFSINKKEQNYIVSYSYFLNSKSKVIVNDSIEIYKPLFDKEFNDNPIVCSNDVFPKINYLEGLSIYYTQIRVGLILYGICMIIVYATSKLAMRDLQKN
jgi:hypothetical protein